ncbi:hypothetical protein BJ878DRAFT_154154 [Calycina marina]|uniref:DUF7624 domain-containing protein n=1 Tax=Calycina marina TaxID=1763456 RepID=A0A9P7YZU3_9HELO|nr:hypothetical protein BJ878DRAFT_154154 [Calycina marina]
MQQDLLRVRLPIMALENPLSPGNIMSALSPYTEFSLSPDSPAQSSPRFQNMSARNSSESSSLRPNAFDRQSNTMFSPSDTVGPSPVTSNGTDATEIEDEASEDVRETQMSPPNSIQSSGSFQTLKRLSTNLPDHLRSSLDDESVSVIHAPEGYMKFPGSESAPTSPPRFSNASTPHHSPPEISVPRMPDRYTPTPYQEGDIQLPVIKVDLDVPQDKTQPRSPPAISTNVPPVKSMEAPTPRAQTRQEVDALASGRSSSLSSLEGIPEEQREEDIFDQIPTHNADAEVQALKTALNECWTLCNTLASLSSIHRERIFSYSGTGDAHETAWKCCWKLCQQLYERRDEDHDLYVRPTLDMCRDFCQALFDVRQRNDEFADSVLRVSFELNNHLYNTHDRNLPEAFRERTLDFYITLCHRLMKQRNELAQETDALLRACWSLAEMLFSLRQNKKDGKPADEELLGSAVQSCWELCDLFREGWTQVRPERGTPRASQTTFSIVSDQMSRSSERPSSVLSKRDSLSSVPENPIHPPPTRNNGRQARYKEPVTPGWNPETPTTEFEDTPISPEENSPSIPNILVLGTEGNRASNARWSSTASSYSQGSQQSTSTITSTTRPDEDINLTRLKVLILKAALNVGFTRTAPTSATSNRSDPPALQNFVKSLPAGAFGALPAHGTLLASYRNLVLTDSTFRSASSLPATGKKVSAIDVAKSVSWMMRSGQYPFLKDLFRLVFGFTIEEADKRKNVSISV